MVSLFLLPMTKAIMDPFNFPAVGDARAVGSKFGSSSGTSTDIIYPVSKQIDEAFQPGRTLELAWKSDQHRFWSPKNTRLFVEYEMMFGEVDETCASIESGPVNSMPLPSVGTCPYIASVVTLD